MTYIKAPGLSRRGFLAGVGGLTFCAVAGPGGPVLVSSAQARTIEGQISPWVAIRPDNSIVILSAGPEMGQGSKTSLPIIIAEEMDADWNLVQVEWAPSIPEIYGRGSPDKRSMAAVGSNTVKGYYDALRLAGAQVRHVLMNAAAAHWEVDVAELQTEPSAVIHAASGNRLTYGEIADFAEIPETLPEVTAADLKDPADFRLIGHSVPRVDIPAKVDGTAKFAMDVHLPGMRYATTLHGPVHGAAPAGWNAEEVEAMPGILRTVGLENGVAIVGETWEQVLDAKYALQVDWDGGAAAGFNSEEVLDRDYAAVYSNPDAPRETVSEHGSVAEIFPAAARRYKAEYKSDMAYHAQMEPLNAVVNPHGPDGVIEVWDGTQAVDRVRRDVATALDLPPEQVVVHQCYCGGGWGRRSMGDYAAEAAVLAREMDEPIKLIWTREEDVAFGMFRPQAYIGVEAALDDDGKVAGWQHAVVGDGGRLISGGADLRLYYDMPNWHLERRGVSHGVRLKHWRAVAHPFNMFAIESLVDEMAHAEEMDPVAFRFERMNITDRGRAVFERVVQMSDFHASRPDGRAVGISMSERSGSLGAGVVEISLDEDSGRIQVHKVWLAVDGGQIVQPDAAKANIESGVVWGLSGILRERITVREGMVEQTNYHDYQVLRMSDMPEQIDIDFVDLGNAPSGLGEIGNPFMGAAIGNALFALTGKRIRHMPFTPERVQALLRA